MIWFEDHIERQKKILHELREEFSLKKKELDIIEASIIEWRKIKTLLDEENKIIRNDTYSMQNTLRVETESLQKIEDRKLQQNIERKELEEDIQKLTLKKSVLEDFIINLWEEEMERKEKNKELYSKNADLFKEIQDSIQILDTQNAQIQKQNNIFKKKENEIQLRELLIEQREKQAQIEGNYISNSIESKIF